MNLKQGQEVRDAADPNRIGIVVGTGSSLGARVLWCFDESLSWTSERPVVVAPRTAEDARLHPEVNDRMEWGDGEVWTVQEIDGPLLIVHDGKKKCAMQRNLWGMTAVYVPHSDAPPPTT